jgi:hypothetical protein
MMTFKDHIDAMKFREQELRDKSDLFLTRAEQIQKERMELELFIDRKQREEDSLTGPRVAG